MITNCAGAGASSSTNSLTGVVTRPDPITGQASAAPIKLNGAAEAPTASSPNPISLSSNALSALLAFQQV